MPDTDPYATDYTGGAIPPEKRAAFKAEDARMQGRMQDAYMARKMGEAGRKSRKTKRGY